MYGLINRAIRDMVCEHHGTEMWEQVKARAEVEESRFLILHSYPDNLTHRLVKAASHVLGLSSGDIVQAFGRCWVEYAGRAGYGKLIEMAGDRLPGFLSNLDELHSRIGGQFPDLRPPEFGCDQIDGSMIKLHYQSSREGLSAMVMGLLEGVGQHLHQSVRVTHVAARQQGADHDIFHIEYESK